MQEGLTDSILRSSSCSNAAISRRKTQAPEAQNTCCIAANLIQLWLDQYDNGEVDHEKAAASTIVEYEAKITALERKVGQLTIELELVKNSAIKIRER